MIEHNIAASLVYALVYSPIVASLLIIITICVMTRVWLWRVEMSGKVQLEEWLKPKVKAVSSIQKEINGLKEDMNKIFQKYPEHWLFNRNALDRIEQMVFLKEIQEFHGTVKEELWQITYY